MTTQVVLARAATAQAKARYLHLKNIIDTKQTESAVTESLTNPIIRGGSKYLEVVNRLKDFEVSVELAPTRVAIVRRKNTMAELSARG